jgi:hypothetical protein
MISATGTENEPMEAQHIAIPTWAERMKIARQNRVTPPKDPSLQTSYLDDGHWVDLARERGLTLPRLSTPCTSGSMTHWLHKLGISREQFYEWCGMHRPIEWHEKNPSFSLRAFCGFLLEECAI